MLTEQTTGRGYLPSALPTFREVLLQGGPGAGKERVTQIGGDVFRSRMLGQWLTSVKVGHGTPSDV
jgi:hypothetical protein